MYIIYNKIMSNKKEEEKYCQENFQSQDEANKQAIYVSVSFFLEDCLL